MSHSDSISETFPSCPPFALAPCRFVKNAVAFPPHACTDTIHQCQWRPASSHDLVKISDTVRFEPIFQPKPRPRDAQFPLLNESEWRNLFGSADWIPTTATQTLFQPVPEHPDTHTSPQWATRTILTDQMESVSHLRLLSSCPLPSTLLEALRRCHTICGDVHML
jgi:hypothetical protein